MSEAVNRRRKEVAIRLAAIIIAAALIAFTIRVWTPLRVAEGVLEDFRIAFFAPASGDGVVIAAIDEASITDMRARQKRDGCSCRSPLDEAYLAELIKNLDMKGASVIGVDIVADESPDTQGRAVLLSTLAAAKAKIIMLAMGDKSLQAKAPNVTFANAPFAVIDDFDHVARRHEPEFQGYPSLAAAAVRAKGGETPMGAFPIRFRTPRGVERAFPAYPAFALNAAPDDWVKGKIVLIGRMETDPALPRLVEDQHLTPLRLREAYRAGLDGVEGHAHVIDQLLAKDRVRTPGALAVGLILLIAAGAGAWLGQKPGGLPPAMARGSAALAVWVAFAVVAYAGFAFMAPVVAAIMSFFLAFVIANRALSVDLEQRRRFLQKAFSQYLSPEVIADIVREPDQLSLTAQNRLITVMSSDMQGFSSLVANYPPEVVARVMNAYFDGLVSILWRHGAMIDKMIGDGLLAIFGAPHDLPDHAAKAVACIKELDAFAEEFRTTCEERFGARVGVTRIGLETGEALVGNFGGTLHFDYTAYGEVVVRAARLQAASKTVGGRILIGPVAAAASGEALALVGDLNLTGVPDALTVFTL